MTTTVLPRPSSSLLLLSTLVALGACAGGASAPAEAPSPSGPVAAAPAPDASPATSPPTASSAGGSSAEVLAAVLGPDRADEPSTLDGIYSDAQAQRGEDVFEDVCAECHSPADWTDDGFLERWNGESVWRFWHYIYEQMPNGAPPYTLSRQQVTDAMAYIFRLNGVPTGPDDLGTDDESIDIHWLVWPAGG